MKKKILIVVDMQNDFIQGSLGSSDALNIVENVVQKIKNYNERNDLVIATLDTHTNDYLNTLEGKKLPVSHCIEGTEGHAINEKIKSCLNANAIYVKKETFGSLKLKDVIEEYLKKERINAIDLEIEILGLCTDICVVSNAILLRAMFPNTKISVPSSCCAGTSKERHEASLEVMKSCQIDVN
ncbi:MAG: cysteine hydrolase family protein [Treponema sp.]